MGILFKIHRKLGSTYQEKYYQRAIEIELQQNHVFFQKEVMINLSYEKCKIGKYFLDFVVDNKIALEIKTVPFLRDEFYKQLLAYLDTTNLKLGIIINFRAPRLEYKRLINPKIRKY
ncbi:MAG: GxxExxY protein [Planctomycetota bacterium]